LIIDDYRKRNQVLPEQKIGRQAFACFILYSSCCSGNTTAPLYLLLCIFAMTKNQSFETALAAVTKPSPEDGNGSQNEESGKPKTGKNLA
jgi:hypothetical protein